MASLRSRKASTANVPTASTAGESIELDPIQSHHSNFHLSTEVQNQQLHPYPSLEQVQQEEQQQPVDEVLDEELVAAEKAQEEKRFESLLKVARFSSLMLDNKGSVARDHLSNERTFLAWVRTAVTFLTLVVALVQIFLVQEMAFSSFFDGETSEILQKPKYRQVHILGKPLIILGLILAIFSLIFGIVRYLQVQALLMKDFFPATRITLVIMLILCMAVALVVFVLAIKLLQ